MRIPPILRKFLFAIAWLWVISIIAFLLSRAVPGDEILDFLSIEQGPYSASLDPASQRYQYERVAKDRGYLLPLFYISIHSGCNPKELTTLLPKEDRHAVRSWISQNKTGRESIGLYQAMRQSLPVICDERGLNTNCRNACDRIHTLMSHPDFIYVRTELTKTIGSLARDSTGCSPQMTQVLVQLQSALRRTDGYMTWSASEVLPHFAWNGSANQYHRWMQSFFGVAPMRSLADGRDAWQKIGIALQWTLLLNGLSFVLGLFFGIRLGIYSGVYAGRWHERWMSILLFALYAVPSFWLATLLIYFFASGEVWALLPTGGLGRGHAESGFFASFWDVTRHLVLPVMCLTVGSLAYVSRQVKQSVLHEMKMPYVTSMRALGVAEKKIMNRHIVRNAMFPVITMAGYSIPALISGSLIIEVIFSIPGMGRLLVNSLMARDWPVAFPILMLVATVTILSYLLTDIVYTRVDPRVKTMQS